MSKKIKKSHRNIEELLKEISSLSKAQQRLNMGVGYQMLIDSLKKVVIDQIDGKEGSC